MSSISKPSEKVQLVVLCKKHSSGCHYLLLILYQGRVHNGSSHTANRTTPKEHVSSSSTPAFSKGDLLERWDYYQDLVGPKNLDTLSLEDRRVS